MLSGYLKAFKSI